MNFLSQAVKILISPCAILPVAALVYIFSEKRLLGIMTCVSMIAVIGSLWFENWRETSGLWLGSFLSTVNFFWMRTFLKALFAEIKEDSAPAFPLFRYLFRYFIFAAIIGLAYLLGLASVVAALLGFLNFITAILIDFFIQFLFGLLKERED